MIKEKVLIIDDDTNLAKVLCEMLQMEGYWIVERAANGLEGVNKYKEFHPDLVLMDMDMPVMDGYESSRQIKAFDPGANILILTGSPDGLRARRTLEEGLAAIILRKPLKWAELGSAIIRYASPLYTACQ